MLLLALFFFFLLLESATVPQNSSAHCTLIQGRESVKMSNCANVTKHSELQKEKKQTLVYVT